MIQLVAYMQNNNISDNKTTEYLTLIKHGAIYLK